MGNRYASGKNAIAEFEAKHKTKVYSVVSADEIFDYLSKNKVNGKLLVTPEIMESFGQYKKQYGI